MYKTLHFSCKEQSFTNYYRSEFVLTKYLTQVYKPWNVGHMPQTFGKSKSFETSILHAKFKYHLCCWSFVKTCKQTDKENSNMSQPKPLFRPTAVKSRSDMNSTYIKFLFSVTYHYPRSRSRTPFAIYQNITIVNWPAAVFLRIWLVASYMEEAHWLVQCHMTLSSRHPLAVMSWMSAFLSEAWVAFTPQLTAMKLNCRKRHITLKSMTRDDNSFYHKIRPFIEPFHKFSNKTHVTWHFLHQFRTSFPMSLQEGALWRRVKHDASGRFLREIFSKYILFHEILIFFGIIMWIKEFEINFHFIWYVWNLLSVLYPLAKGWRI